MNSVYTVTAVFAAIFVLVLWLYVSVAGPEADPPTIKNPLGPSGNPAGRLK
jgi:hypothetical protein